MMYVSLNRTVAYNKFIVEIWILYKTFPPTIVSILDIGMHAWNGIWSYDVPTARFVCIVIPANCDEIFSLHTDAPRRCPFRCQPHSHCCLNAARLHSAAARSLSESLPVLGPLPPRPYVIWISSVRCWKVEMQEERGQGERGRLPNHASTSGHARVSYHDWPLHRTERKCPCSVAPIQISSSSSRVHQNQIWLKDRNHVAEIK